MKLQLDDLDELVGQLAVLEEEVDFGHVVELKIGPVFFSPRTFFGSEGSGTPWVSLGGFYTDPPPGVLRGI